MKELLRASVSGLALVICPVAAHAASDVGASSPPEIIVTAQKRAQSLEKTPLSVSVVTADEIAKRAVTTLDQALKDVPGVEMQTISQGVQLYIRGVGSSIDPGFADPAIALTIDGVYNGRTEALGTGAFDLTRIEVLRGPQGTLYGRNASGGLVNVITQDPDLDKISGYGRAQLGNYALMRAEGALNIPLASNLAVRASGYREKRDGYIDDGSMDSNSWGARLKVLWQPAGWLKIVGKADFFNQFEHGPNTVPVPGNGDNLGFPPPLFAGWTGWQNGWPQRQIGNPWSNDPQHAVPTTRNNGQSFGAQVDADLGFATLTLLPSYTRLYHFNKSNYIFGSLVFGGAPTNDDSGYNSAGATTFYKSIEARLTSKAGSPLQYMLGLYFLRTNPGTPLSPQNFTDTNNVVIGTYSQTVLPGSTKAAFGQWTYSLTPKLRATGGFRYSEDKTSQSYDILLNATGDVGLQVNSISQSSTQYKVGLEFDAASHWLLYGHVSTGFKQGGMSVTVPPVAFRPEHLTAFEIGSKARLFNGLAQLNMAGFHYHYVDYQYSAFLPLAIGNTGQMANFFLVQNAGPTNIDGAEIQLNAMPWPGGHFNISSTWLHARYGTAALPVNPFVGGGVTLTGRQIQNSPNFAGNIGLEQDFATPLGKATLGVRTRISSSYYATTEQELPGAFQSSYHRTDLTAVLEPMHNLTLGLAVRNLENEAQTTGVYPAWRRFVSAPRTVVGSIGFKF